MHLDGASLPKGVRDSSVEGVASLDQLVTKVVPRDAVFNLLQCSIARANLISRQLTCVCVCEREKERERQRSTHIEHGCACICLRMYVYTRMLKCACVCTCGASVSRVCNSHTYTCILA